jgi:lysophospholipase L1-like esterase
MKQIITFFIIVGLLVFMACEVKSPNHPELKITRYQLLLSKMVYLGNSLTAGLQSAGLVKDFQTHSYPYLIAKQLGKADDFEQPLIDDPGISSTPGVGVLDFVNGNIVPRGTYTNPLALLLNATLSRPYDNLGVPGADLNDVLNTVDGSGGNPFFDLVLRNPNFGGMTQLEQVIVLSPTLVVAWVGSNDVLGAAIDGGDLTQITSTAEFTANYTTMVTELGSIHNGQVGIIVFNIPNVTDIPYVNVLDNIFQTIPLLGITSPVPVLFKTEANALGGINFVPIDFGGFYLPLYTAEFASGVTHVLLPTLSQYQSTGLGVPDSAIIAATLITQAGWDTLTAAGTAQQLVAGLVANGLTPSGVAIPGNLTITATEDAAIESAVTGFNQIISGIAGNVDIPVIDANQLLHELNMNGVDGYSGKFILTDPVNTAFSLDGVHPNNGGNAIIANKVISLMNTYPDIQIPLINTAQYKGQYLGKPVATISKEAVNLVKPLFVKNKN